MGRAVKTEILDVADADAASHAAEALAAGEVIVLPFNGIFALVGNADDPAVAPKVAEVKRRSVAQGVSLVCPPEFVAEHVAEEEASAWTVARVRALYEAVHALGLILPAASPGAPPHVVRAGTILNIWTEERPISPLRRVALELRQRGGRALAGTSANVTGRPTITDPDEVVAVFEGRVPLIVLDSFEAIAPTRRHSATIVDLTRAQPLLVREGSVRARELRAELRRLGLGELTVPANVRQV